jgi:RNA polymerase-interacting CarD/CdnL/TRCF family regulator
MKLPTVKELSVGTWNRRYRQFQELLVQGPEARKLVADALIAISTTKDLSYGERKMLSAAQNWDKYLSDLQEKKSKFDAEVRRSKFYVVK